MGWNKGKEIGGLTVGEAKRPSKTRRRAGKIGAGGDDECLNEGGKGHHTRTPRPNLDLDLDLDWT